MNVLINLPEMELNFTRIHNTIVWCDFICKEVLSLNVQHVFAPVWPNFNKLCAVEYSLNEVKYFTLVVLLKNILHFRSC